MQNPNYHKYSILISSNAYLFNDALGGVQSRIFLQILEILRISVLFKVIKMTKISTIGY